MKKFIGTWEWKEGNNKFIIMTKSKKMALPDDVYAYLLLGAYQYKQRKIQGNDSVKPKQVLNG